MIIDYKEINGLSKVLDYRAAKTQIIGSNIANIDTPGYKAKELDFDKVFKNAQDSLHLNTTNANHLGGGNNSDPLNDVKISEEPGRADGNNVSIDEEMMALNKNSINYNLTAHFVKDKLTKIREAIEKSAV